MLVPQTPTTRQERPGTDAKWPASSLDHQISETSLYLEREPTTNTEKPGVWAGRITFRRALRPSSLLTLFFSDKYPGKCGHCIGCLSGSPDILSSYPTPAPTSCAPLNTSLYLECEVTPGHETSWTHSVVCWSIFNKWLSGKKETLICRCLLIWLV